MLSVHDACELLQPVHNGLIILVQGANDAFYVIDLGVRSQAENVMDQGSQGVE
jgi:hypothetical protein